jgi:hypothetical protein
VTFPRIAARAWLAGTVIALAAVAFITGCGLAHVAEPTRTSGTPAGAPPAPARLHGQAAHAARAVDVLARALRDGDAGVLTRPRAGTRACDPGYVPDRTMQPVAGGVMASRAFFARAPLTGAPHEAAAGCDRIPLGTPRGWLPRDLLGVFASQSCMGRFTG